MNERDKELYEQAEKYADVEFKGEGGAVWVEAFESKFAELIRADEREACALICDEHADDPVYCGAAIRARGNT